MVYDGQMAPLCTAESTNVMIPGLLADRAGHSVDPDQTDQSTLFAILFLKEVWSVILFAILLLKAQPDQSIYCLPYCS